MTNILSWNIRGIKSKGTFPYLKTILSKHKPEVLVLWEPLVEGTQIDKFRRAIRFEEAAHGGTTNTKIWIFWNSETDIRDFQWDQQHVNCNIKNIWYTFVYVKCNRTERTVLWDSLIDKANTINYPWLVGGDLNTIAHPGQKNGKEQS